MGHWPIRSVIHLAGQASACLTLQGRDRPPRQFGALGGGRNQGLGRPRSRRREGIQVRKVHSYCVE